MQPFFNPFQPQPSNNGQSSANLAPFNPQVFPLHSSLANCMPVQPQVGLMNTQIPIPFNNSNVQFSNSGQAMPNIPLLMTQQPGFMNAFMPQMMAHYNMGFPPQNNVRGFGAAPMFVNQVNPCQGQVFAPNFNNLPQQLNQSMCFPNSHNPMPNMNPGVPTQMPNPSQVVSYNGPPGSHQALGTQNPNLLVNPMFAAGLQVNPNQQNVMIPASGANTSMPFPITTQQVQGNLSTPVHTQNSQPSAFMNNQSNPGKIGQSGTPISKRKNFPRKDFARNPKKSHIHQKDNRKKKFGFSNGDKSKGHGYEKEAKFGHTNPSPANQTGELRRSLFLTYTEQEIKQWREERRKNYPSKANIEKKQSKKLTDSMVTDREAKLRREQLKEILAKQAQLGVEVAEIPSCYLSDSEKKVHGREDDRRPSNKRGRSRNKDRRGRNKRNDQFVKNQKFAGKDSSDISSLNKKNPTLLQKLLSADIRRDKHRLLQVFRFMVLNSFFKDWPDNPLKFPLVVVKEDGYEDEVVEEKSSIIKEDGFEARGKIRAEEICRVDNNDDDHYNHGDDDKKNSDSKCNAQVEQSFVKGKGRLIEEVDRNEEEEGEITD